MNATDPYIMDLLKFMMNDYHKIMKTTSFLTPEDTIRFYNRFMRMVERKIFDCQDKNVVFVTHHTPSYRSIRTDDSVQWQLNHVYCNDLEDWIEDLPQIKAWIHGHVHKPYDYMIGRCRVVSNPFGYPEHNKPSHGKIKTIDV